MKTILVAVSGTKSDDTVLDAAFAVSEPLNAHLDFIHMPLNEIDLSDYNHHIEFARGEAVETALRETLLNTQDAVAKARKHVADYCAAKNIVWVSSPAVTNRVTASWASSPISSGIDGLVKVARTHDLTVVGRSAGGRSWSQNLLEALATETGRPVLIVPHDCQEMTLGTIAVWWKDHGAAARALTAALPLLKAANRVALLSVCEGDGLRLVTTSDLSDQLAWHGIDAAVEILDQSHRPTTRALWSATLGKQADLVVMGGFSRSRIKEIVFGGCTRDVLEAGIRPIFMLH
jgi:nucleotide-binding universal stress UspA family protein